MKSFAKTCGFTLLEVLVVIVIIAIILSFAGLAVGNGGLDKQIQRESQRLQALLQLAAQEAIMRQVQIGVGFSRNGYQFYQWQSTTRTWGLVEEEETIFRARSLPAALRFSLEVETRRIALGDFPKIPHVMLYSSAEMTLFECFVYADHQQSTQVYQLSGLFNGELLLTVRPQDEVWTHLDHET